jgi:O-antigen ligase
MIAGVHRATAAGPQTEPIEAGWLDRHPSTALMVMVLVGSSAALGVVIAHRPVAGAGVVAAMAVGLGVLHRPALGGYLLAGLVPITSGLRTGWPVPVFRFSELLIGTISVAILVPASARQSLRWRTLDYALLTYVLASLLIGAYDLHHDHVKFTTSLIGTLAGPLQFLLVYRAVAVSLPLRPQRNTALRLLLLGSVPVSLLAVLQQLRISGVNRFIANITGTGVFQTYDYSFFARATGPFNHWTPLAGYLLVILLTGASLLLHGVEGVLSRRAVFLILGLAALGLLLSAELSAMIALICGAVALGAWSGRLAFLVRWGLLIVIVLGVAFGSYFTQRLQTQFYSTAGSGRSAAVPQTINFRWQIWTQQYFPAIEKHPFTGYGPVLPTSITWPDTESQYVTLLMWGGIPLLVAFVGMMWALFGRARSMARPKGDDPSRWAMARAVVVLVVALYPINAIFPYMTTGGLPQAMWVLIGIMVAVEHDREHRPVRVPQNALLA